MFKEITENGIRWEDRTEVAAGVILWSTGFCGSLDHLASLQLREDGGGIVITGRLATHVAKDPRIHLVGYGPSASTIGANRAGPAADRELSSFPGVANLEAVSVDVSFREDHFQSVKPPDRSSERALGFASVYGDVGNTCGTEVSSACCLFGSEGRQGGGGSGWLRKLADRLIGR
jgi:hypothetical protein